MTAKLTYGETYTKRNPLAGFRFINTSRYRRASQKYLVDLAADTSGAFKSAVDATYSSPPDNPYDDDSMIVWSAEGRYIGHMAAEVAVEWLAFDVDAPVADLPAPCVMMETRFRHFQIPSAVDDEYDADHAVVLDHNGNPTYSTRRQLLVDFRLAESTTAGAIDLSLGGAGAVNDDGFQGLPAGSVAYLGTELVAHRLTDQQLYQKKWHRFQYRQWIAAAPQDSSGSDINPHADIYAKPNGGGWVLAFQNPSLAAMPSFTIG